MFAIIKREFNFYFSNLTGYFVFVSYLTINALFLWFFDTPYQLLKSGFGNLNPFFEISPLLFIFLIPSLCMRAFSEERTSGTLEILLTKPLDPIQIFGGKFLSISIILGILISSSFFNVIAINALLEKNSSLDWGAIFLSYLSLILVGLIFIAISLSISLLFRNQVTSFIVSAILCFTQFFIWNFIAEFSEAPFLYKLISEFGIQNHYLSLIQGVLKLNDIIYLLGLIILFFLLGVELINKEDNRIK